MPFTPVPNSAQYEIRMLWDNQEVENTIWVNHGADPTGTAIADMAEAIRIWYTNGVLANLSNQVRLVEVYGVDMSSQTGPTGTSVAPANQVGQVASPSMPNNVAMCVSFRTARRGRWFRGRNYVPGMAEDGVTNNAFLASRTAAIVAAYNSLIGVVADNGGTWVVASRRVSNAPRLTGITEPVTAALVTDDYVDSQRRRLPGRGR